MYDFAERSCREFVEVLASKEAVPGGGGASALAGAIGAALGSMVANLTIPNPRFSEVAEELSQVLARLTELQSGLLDCVREDAIGFEPLSRAYGLPRGTEEEKKIRERVMEDALVKACEAPIHMVELCAETIDLMEILAKKGAKLVVSDAGVGVVLAKSAMQGAILNVYINTKMMKDRMKAAAMDTYCEQIVEAVGAKADRIYQMVCGRIR